MADQTRVWVADAHQGWALGTITVKNGNKLSIKLDSGEVSRQLLDRTFQIFIVTSKSVIIYL
jgi:hypothetical protein